MPIEALSLEAENTRLRAALAEERAKTQALQKSLAQLRAQYDQLNRDFQQVGRQLKQLLAQRGLGQRSEVGQLLLFGEPTTELAGAEEAPAQPPHVDEAPDGETPGDFINKRNKPKRPARQLDTGLLPRVLLPAHEVPQEERVCKTTGVLLVPVGTKEFEELDYVPAQLRVLVHQRVVYGPPPEIAKQRKIEKLVAPLPPRAIEGCAASAGLIAHLLVLKYGFHLPLYRQEELLQQSGLWIPRQTLCDWVMKAAFALKPIVVALLNQIRAGPVLQLDDTPVKCQGDKGQALFQAYLWTFVNPEVEGVGVGFTAGRSAEDLAPLLGGATASYVLGDGYKGNAAAARIAGLNVTMAGCWAHATRAFRAAKKEASQMATLFQDDIRALYTVEDEATERGMDAEARRALRREKSRPILARILRRTRGWKDLFSNKGDMAEAIKYLLNHRQMLLAYLKDGRVPLDNNACERAIRPIAVGRKNWLFAGSTRGGEAAAIAYTLIASCRPIGLDPWDYLRDVLVRVATHPASRVAELIPARWAALFKTAPAA